MPFDHLPLEQLISRYGVLAVFLGAAFEGETAVFLGGALAHRHLMTWWEAVSAAAIGSCLVDQAWFFAGRYASRLAVVRRFKSTSSAARVNHLLETHPTGFILAFRFIYGMRTVSPVIIGLSSVPVARFVTLNIGAAIIWATLVTTVGYLFGNVIETLFGRLHLHMHLVIAIAIIAVAVLLVAFLSRHWLARAFHRAGAMDQTAKGDEKG